MSNSRLVRITASWMQARSKQPFYQADIKALRFGAGCCAASPPDAARYSRMRVQFVASFAHTPNLLLAIPCNRHQIFSLLPCVHWRKGYWQSHAGMLPMACRTAATQSLFGPPLHAVADQSQRLLPDVLQLPLGRHFEAVQAQAACDGHPGASVEGSVTFLWLQLLQPAPYATP